MKKTSTGNYSTGDCSTGNYSTGDFSTGHYSTGDYSTGYRSTGDHSTGYRSTGNWSISNYSSGHFSTEDYTGFGCFDEPCSVEEWNKAHKPYFLFFNLTEWIKSDEMTDEEKSNNPSHKTTGGYLKVYDYKEAFKKSWYNADKEDRIRIKELPNFNAEKFKEISGIDVAADDIPEYTMEELTQMLGENFKIKK